MGRRAVAALLASAVVGAVMAVIVLVGGVRPPAFPTVAEAPLPEADGRVALVRRAGDEACVLVADTSDGDVRTLRCERGLDGGLAWPTDDAIAVDRWTYPGERLLLDPDDGSLVGREELGRPTTPLRDDHRRADGVRAVTGGSGREAWLDIVPDDGPGTRVLTVRGPRGYSLGSPTWAPDGRHLLLRDSAGRLLLATTTGAVRVLADDVDQAAWEP